VKKPSFILGIDAAWTAHQASGVALVRVPKRGKPRLLAVARSYEEFLEAEKLTGPAWQTRVTGTPPDLEALLQACERMTTHSPSLIALDIPLSNRPFKGRRRCDNAVTSAYVARGAGTHSPSENRPGPISKSLFHQLRRAGYYWLKNNPPSFSQAIPKYFAETYPHPAIIELMGLPKRLAYKTSRLLQYWPGATTAKRWQNVCDNLDKLRRALAREIEGVDRIFPSAHKILKLGRRGLLKNFEDALDAVVCAWIGIQILQGRALAYGDRAGAIWVPRPRVVSSYRRFVVPSSGA
jgi:predicted RNase H-like nuclease